MWLFCSVMEHISCRLPMNRQGEISVVCLEAAFRASLMAQMVKRLLAMQETWVQSLGWEDSPGEGNSNPLQYSCLENPMDGGACWLQTMGSQRIRHD